MFYKQNINSFNDNFNTNLLTIIEKNDNIFLKMDIEGGEYPWINQLSEKELLKFKLLSSRVSIVIGIFPEPVNSILGYPEVPVSGKIPIFLSILAIIIAPE